MYASLASLALLPLALGKTIVVNVGQNGLTFSPSIVAANPGDKVDFHYFPKNHSVVQSSFQSPCVPIQPNGGIFSGFQPTASGENPNVFEVTVNDTTPVWIYCAQKGHCQQGMSMVINQPNNNKTLAAYQAAAKNVPTSSNPPSINGGIFIKNTISNGTNATSTSGSGSKPAGTGSSSASGTVKAFSSGVVSFTGGAAAMGRITEVTFAAVVVASGLLFL